MAFVLNIKDLPDGVNRLEFLTEASDFTLDYMGIGTVGTLRSDVEVTKSNDQIIFRGRVAAPLKLMCSRCAEEYEELIESEFAFVLAFVAPQQEEELQDEDSEDFHFIPEGTIEYDFTPQIRELLILSIGIKPLCKDDCRGICSRCGKNLNIEQCDCNKEEIDERWLPLKDLTDRR
jgi:uncharacterized protein